MTEESTLREDDWLKSFNFEGKEQPVSFVETTHVCDRVECDVYVFGDPNKDFGIIRIDQGCKTPLQRVLDGDKTIEGYLSGRGKLTITKTNGQQVVYAVSGEMKEPLSVSVEIGEIVQWEADKDSNLVAFEVCFPPFKDGRFENL